ncbi:MAG: hypothetical protein QM719_03955 [Thermomonas sp.]
MILRLIVLALCSFAITGCAWRAAMLCGIENDPGHWSPMKHPPINASQLERLAEASPTSVQSWKFDGRYGSHWFSSEDGKLLLCRREDKADNACWSSTWQFDVSSNSPKLIDKDGTLCVD